jgi:tetratricopeptide (TPR) repeat protein
MPPKTALVRLATRRSPYVCHTCLSGLTKERPDPSAVRSYARASKGQPRLPRDAKTPSNNSTRGAPEKPFTVKYFEKDAKGVVREMPVGEDADDVDMEDIKALEASAMAKIAKLDATLDSMNNKSQFLERILEKHGPKGAVEAYKKALETSEAESETTQIPLLSQTKGPRGSRELPKINKTLKLLNASIKLSTTKLRNNQLESKDVSRAWSYFGQLAPILSDPQRLVPEKAWEDLWAVFSWESEQNPQRMAHILGLCQAMVSHGAELSDEQKLLHIEAAFAEGYEKVALENWKRLCPTLGGSHPSAMTFWSLGVRLWSRHGDIERAERACQAVLDRASASTPADSRVLLHLIKAYVSTSDITDAEKGFKLYRRMRALASQLGKPIKIEDYDDIMAIFLSAGHTNYAMYAFTDMIYSGAVNLHGNKELPTFVNNSFFFGKWLKRLIGAGDFDGAYKVLVYMQKNGIMAAAVQVNGLIGAWYRSRTAQNREKAERLAWSMIHTRRTYVKLRQRERSMEWPIRLEERRQSNPEHKDTDVDYTMVPRATAETFILLAENYRERGLFVRLEELFVAYKECEIGGDAMMMNELIMAAVEQGDAGKARELYELMVHEHTILPNTDTFAILFKSLPINSLRGRQLPQIAPEMSAESLSLARACFRDLVSTTGLHLEKRRTRHGELSEDQVKLILHSFRKCADWAGLMVALVCLRDLMRFKITRNVLLEMIAEYEGIDRPSPRSTKLVMLTTMKLQTMIQRMQERQLQEQQQNEGAGLGIEAKAAQNPSEVKDPHMLYELLVEYYYEKAEVDYRGRENVAQALRIAQKEMGAVDIASFKLSASEDKVGLKGSE